MWQTEIRGRDLLVGMPAGNRTMRNIAEITFR